MSQANNPDNRAGWDHIWRSDNIPGRYQTLAAPNDSVVAWAEALPPGGAVLDIGCGVGRHVLYLGGRGFNMSGVDISPTGIETTKSACAERGIEFGGKVSEMSVLSWPDNSFDGALSIATLHHNRLADILRSLDEVYRLLKPGGLFLVDFPSKTHPSYELTRRDVAAGKISEPEPDTFIDDRPDSPDGDGFLPHHYVNEADLRDLLRRFEIINIWPDTHNWNVGRGKLVASARRPAER